MFGLACRLSPHPETARSAEQSLAYTSRAGACCIMVPRAVTCGSCAITFGPSSWIELQRLTKTLPAVFWSFSL